VPQLTPDCDRVVVAGLPPSDGMQFNPLHVVKLFQLMMEIIISEDYCRSDIYVLDFGKFTPRHVTKITPSIVKNAELCTIVSSKNIFCANNESRT